MHGSYSMLDFGDRPAHVLNDVRRARDIERLGDRRPARPETMEPDGPAPAPTIKQSVYSEVKPVVVADRDRDQDDQPEPIKPGDASRKKAAVVLMQEGKALEIGRHYLEARRKYMEAARLNAPFRSEEVSPESELARLDVAAGRKIAAWVDEARTCIDRKDAETAMIHLDEAHALAKGMGLDASVILELKSTLKPAAPVIRNNSRAASNDVPMPIIHSGRRPVSADNPPVKTVGGADEPPADPIPHAKPIPPARTEDVPSVIKPIPATRPMRIGKGPTAIPEIPDVTIESDTVKPPKADDTAKADRSKGMELLAAARMECKKGDYEAARKIAVELINGPYGVKDEAVALLKSCETAERSDKQDSAQRAFRNGVEAFESYHYAQALAIFQQIDGTLLPSQSRKKLGDMIRVASVKKKEVEAATAARNGSKAHGVRRPSMDCRTCPSVQRPESKPAPTVWSSSKKPWLKSSSNACDPSRCVSRARPPRASARVKPTPLYRIWRTTSPR